LKNLFGKGTADKQNGDPARDGSKQFQVSSHAMEVSREIRIDSASRDGGRKPAIMLHGVMPRSGTVHVGNLISLHPELARYPNEIWEFPFLSSTASLLEFQANFFNTYSMNDDKIGRDDFQSIFGAAFVRYLHAFIPPGKRLFVKEPRVNYLEHFVVQFPHEFLVLLMRDGRDVVASTMRSWPESKFEKVCEEWNEAAERIAAFVELHERLENQFLFVKFEEVLEDPTSFVKTLCAKAGLTEAEFPFEKIADLPVQGSSALQPDGQVVWEPQTKPVGFNPVGRWENWTAAQKTQFKSIAGETLVKHGYEPSLDW